AAAIRAYSSPPSMDSPSRRIPWPASSWMQASIPARWECTCAVSCFQFNISRARCNSAMPEGDTLFRTARTLGRALIDKPITGFRSTYPLLTRFNDDTPVVGQTVDGVESRGKWLLIHFSGGGTLVTHLLMSGSWHIYRPGERWQKPRFLMPVAHMHTAQSLARDTRIPHSENDVLSADFDAVAALRRLLTHGNEEI